MQAFYSDPDRLRGYGQWRNVLKGGLYLVFYSSNGAVGPVVAPRGLQLPGI